ncbi:hypothetical protein ACLOJK_010923 [Asimina triloba]
MHRKNIPDSIPSIPIFTMFYISASSRLLLFLLLVCSVLFWHPTTALRLLKSDDKASSIRDSSSSGFSCQIFAYGNNILDGMR